MYIVKIKTKYNIIEGIVEDINTPEMEELLNQPYIEEVYIQSPSQYEDKSILPKKLTLGK